MNAAQPDGTTFGIGPGSHGPPASTIPLDDEEAEDEEAETGPEDGVCELLVTVTAPPVPPAGREVLSAQDATTNATNTQLPITRQRRVIVPRAALQAWQG